MTIHQAGGLDAEVSVSDRALSLNIFKATYLLCPFDWYVLGEGPQMDSCQYHICSPERNRDKSWGKSREVSPVEPGRLPCAGERGMRIETWKGREKFPILHTQNHAFIAESITSGRIKLIDWIASFLSSRSQYVHFSSTRSPSRFRGSSRISLGSFIVFNLCQLPTQNFFFKHSSLCWRLRLMRPYWFGDWS